MKHLGHEVYIKKKSIKSNEQRAEVIKFLKGKKKELKYF